MPLTREQEIGLRKIVSFFRSNRTWNRRGFFYLGGYAGTGKSYLVQKVAEAIGCETLFLALTGKAASVLLERGVSEAQTIHSAIYTPKGEVTLESIRAQAMKRIQNPVEGLDTDVYVDALRILDSDAEDDTKKARLRRLDPSFSTGAKFSLKEYPKTRNYGLVVVDECSMLSPRIVEDIVRSSHAVLFLGDPNQLPPIKSRCYFQDREPDFMLRDIQRQSELSSVISLAGMIIRGERLSDGRYGSSRVLSLRRGEKLTREDVLGHSQILVGKHVTRRQANARWRSEAGRQSWYPERGDKLVCKVNDPERGLFNGTQWFVEEVDGDLNSEYIPMTVTDENSRVDITTHRDFFTPGPEPKGRFLSDQFVYGNAMTVHSAQGSEWDSVMVIDQSHVFGSNARRHLYTAITRARHRVTVVRTGS